MIYNPDIGIACNDAGKAGFMQRGGLLGARRWADGRVKEHDVAPNCHQTPSARRA